MVRRGAFGGVRNLLTTNDFYVVECGRYYLFVKKKKGELALPLVVNLNREPFAADDVAVCVPYKVVRNQKILSVRVSILN